MCSCSKECLKCLLFSDIYACIITVLLDYVKGLFNFSNKWNFLHNIIVKEMLFSKYLIDIIKSYISCIAESEENAK